MPSVGGVLLDGGGDVIRQKAVENQPVVLRRRVLARAGTGATVTGEEGKLILQANISTISRSCYDVQSTTAGTAIEGPTTITAASAIFDALQTDWVKDSVGYNFQNVVPASVSTDRGNKLVRVVYTLTLTGGDVIVLLWDLDVFNAIP